MRQLVLIGAGEVGLAAAGAIVEDGLLDRVVVVEPDQARRRRADEVLGASGASATATAASLDEVPAATAGDWALLTFSSEAAPVAAAIERVVVLGYDVVTTCEELAAPDDEVTRRLDAVARDAGRVVVATGADPGWAMDRLPLLVAGGSRGWRRLDVTRRVDTSTRREALVRKSGYGMTPEQFDAGVADGRVGHVGLSASLRLVAEAAGVAVGAVHETIEPVLDDEGRVVGQHQVAVAGDDTGRELRYDLTMAWGIDALDRVQVDGAPPLHVEVAGGLHGDTGTTARVVAPIRQRHRLSPGFYRPTDLPVGV